MNELDQLIPELMEHNEKNRGIFFVINSGGHEDREITKINAQFFESDGLSIEEQMEQIHQFPLEPSIIVKTRKSLHVYYLIRDGRVGDFRRIQEKLVQHFQADSHCVNESRVFRLPSFQHCKQEPIMVECIKFNPEIRYTQEELEAYLPEITVTSPKERVAPETVNTDQKGIELTCRQCLFMEHCRDNAATLSEHDWYAMISNLAVFDGGRSRIHEYSSSYPNYSYEETERKIDQFFNSKTGPMSCTMIAKKGFQCPKLPEGCGCTSPAGLSFRPMGVKELIQIVDSLPIEETMAENAAIINEFIRKYLFNAERTIAETLIDHDLKKKFKLKSTKPFKDYYRELKTEPTHDKNQENEIDFSKPLNEMLLELNVAYLPGKPPINKVTDSVIEWFTKNDARFYKNIDDTCYMHYDKQLIYLGRENPAFTSLLYSLGKINVVTYEGRCIIQAMRDHAFNYGYKIETASWIHEKNGVIYVNLHNDNNEIIKISAGHIEVMQNGNNPDSIVLLKGGTRVEEIKYVPNVDVNAGLSAFKEHFLDNLACAEDNRLLVGCYAFAILLKNFVSAHPVAKFSGISGSGKSIAAKLLTTLIYGEEQLTNNTIAANYASASRDPVIVMENKEARDLVSEELNFLITIATGISRGKRKMGTDSDTMAEKGNCLVVVTAIEPFNIAEIIDRIYDIEFHKSLQRSGFMESIVMRKLKENRTLILNAFFYLLSTILHNFEKKRQDMFTLLSGLKHVKERTNDFLTLLCIILDELLRQLPSLTRKTTTEVITTWTDYFNATSDETKEGTNTNLFMLDYILDSLKKTNSDHYIPTDEERREGEYIGERAGEIIKDDAGNVIGFTTTPARLFAVFSMIAKQLSLKDDYRYLNVKQMGVRLSNDKKFLEGQGWHMEQVKVVNGERYRKFYKK